MTHNFPQSFPAAANTPLGGRYEIIQQLGAGGFGRTFLARDLHLPGHPACVVKQLNPQVDNPEEWQVASRLFNTEAQVLYRLGSHPQIPALLAHFEENRDFYLAQELIEGHSLADELAPGTAWSDDQVIAFLDDILETLAFVHTNQVIHRDIKPSNLIRRHSDNRVVLIDFGAVKQVNTQLSNARSRFSHTISIGTQGYMPNEQIAGRPQFSSDVYAVGMVAIQALTGHSPETIEPDPQTAELNWHHLAPHNQPALKSFLDYMVCYDFRSRYATAGEALSALRSTFSSQSWSSASPGLAASPSSSSPPGPPRQPELPYRQPSPSMAVQTVAVGRQPQWTQHTPGTDQFPTAAASSSTEVARPRPRHSRGSRNNVLLPLGMGFIAVLGLGLLTWRLFSSTPETATSPATVSPVPEEAAPGTADTTAPTATSPETETESAAVEEPTTETTEAAAPSPESEAATSEPQPADQPVDEVSEPSSEPPQPEEAAPTISPEAAQAAVGSLYRYVSSQSWDAARSMFAGNLAQQFDPNFFQQFQQVTVENLRVTNQTADTVEMVGQNTYIYADGSTQREERTFTVQMVDGQPRIVGSSFVSVLQPRSN
jgi:serine/threonine protein kinase